MDAKTGVWTLALALAAMPVPGIACGVCIDDKVAAVYDHVVVQEALTAGRMVLFCELSGARQVSALAPAGKRAAQRLPAVDHASVRTSDELPMLSFALDPSRQSPAAALAALQQRLAAEGIKARLLRVMKTD